MSAVSLLKTAARVLLLGLVLALSIPGLRVAHAETDLAPSADQLLGLQGPPPAAPAGQACEPRVVRAGPADRNQAMQRLAELMASHGEGQALNNRGIHYPQARSQWLEMQRIHMEARRLRADQQAAAAQ
jgi:hypothetical protein